MYGKCFSNIAGDPVASSVKFSLVFMHERPENTQVSKETLGQLMIANDVIEMAWDIKRNR